MERTSTSGFGRVIMPNENKKIRKKTIGGINKKMYLQFTYCVIGYLCGGGSILMGLNPMALGYLSVFLMGKYEFNSILVCTVAGFFMSYAPNNTPRYILSAILMFGANFILNGTVKTEKKRILIGAGCVLIGGGIIAAIGGMSPFLTLKAVMECGLSYVFALILVKGREVIDGGLKRTILTEEECISLIVLFGCVLLGGRGFFAVRS